MGANTISAFSVAVKKHVDRRIRMEVTVKENQNRKWIPACLPRTARLAKEKNEMSST